MRELKSVLMVFLMLIVAVGAQAATYGYLNVDGLREKERAVVVNKLKQHIQKDLKGKVLHVAMVKTGKFIKRTRAVVIFKGEEKAIVKFLNKGIYSGDYIGRVEVRCTFNRKDSKGSVSIGTKAYANIENALAAFVGKNASDLDPKASKARAVFYNGRYSEGNKIFQYLDGKSFVKGIKAKSPIGFGDLIPRPKKGKGGYGFQH